MSTQNVKVSIVVPVYNAEKTIERTLNSLCSQTLREIEIICVLDKPTDNSECIVKAMAEKDDRIVVIENDSNKGVAESRNIGMKHARGQYVGFSDNDDFQEKDMYEMLYKTSVEYNSNVCFSDVYIDFSGGGDTVAEIHPVCADYYDIPSDVSDISILAVFKDPTRDSLVRDLLVQEELMINFCVRDVWNCLYKKSFIENNGIFFLDRSKFNEEDTLFNLMCYSKTDRISYCNKPFYHWCRQPHSLATAACSHSEAMDKVLNMMEMKWDILENNCLKSYRKDFWIGFSYYFRRYYVVIKAFDAGRKHRMHELIVHSGFPLLGKYRDMKLFSKIRIKLFFLTVQLKYFTR